MSANNTTNKTLGDGTESVVAIPSGTQDVNLTQIAGTAASVDEGASDAGTLRVVEATTGLGTPKTATGAAAIAYTTDMGVAWELVSVTLKLSAAGTTSENFTITLDADVGAAYATNLFTEDLSIDSVVSLVLTPEDGLPKKYNADDELVFAWPNTETRTYGLAVNWRPI
jgi:hypothetical protein